MRKIRLICGLIFVVIVILLAIFIPKRYFYISVQEDKVYYGMDISELRSIKGVPEEISNSLPGDPVCYLYSETIEGSPAKVSYKFIDAKLVGADYITTFSSDQDCLSAFKKFKAKLTDTYGKKKPFAVLELDDLTADESFSITNSKYNCSMTVKGPLLTISCNKSE
ncbi:MAG: hypothetical protein IJY33_04645 [Oscillospiraceae bacterium]|nr:hypothetical protein [Oscillospiraceae bacterium]